jgi:integrase
VSTLVAGQDGTKERCRCASRLGADPGAAVRAEPVVIRSPEQAADLIAALPELRDRALWATAFYAGLRRGELMALRWQDLDLATGTLQVERSFDPKAGVFVGPKSRAGRRQVPIAGALRDALLDLRVSFDTPDQDALVLADEDGEPFAYSSARKRAKEAWEAAGLDPIGLHAARHTAAALMIAAGVNVKALSTFMGHFSITITLDRYGHLMPGSIGEATTLLDAYLARTGARTGAQPEESLQIGGR